MLLKFCASYKYSHFMGGISWVIPNKGTGLLYSTKLKLSF